ncbi:MAG TPA: winged helix-turn-helix domain-containing protein, partial [Bryocella sp.]|nr:winged helix-turn-helix domain-containing protein [Bryocella sp.]
MSATQKLLRFGVFELNLDTLELRKSGTLVKLPPQPFKLLVLLASHAGQIVTREEIEEQLWDDDTHVDFEHGVNKCIKQIRSVLGDDADKPLYIETLPRQGYRFLAPVVSKTIATPAPRVVESHSGERRSPFLPGSATETPAAVAGSAAANYAVAAQVSTPVPAPHDEPVVTLPAVAPATEPHRRAGHRTFWIALLAIVVAALAAGILYWRAHGRPALSEKDTIVLSDFDNQTGDAIFDDALKQALRIQLEQSPFLALISDARVNRTLRLMGRAADEPLSPDVAREVCLRTGSAAVITGSIVSFGSRYLIGLKALACNGGDVIAEAQKEAPNREAV